MGSRRRGLSVKWLGGICGMLFVGGGNAVGALAQRLVYESGMVWETAALLRWVVTGGLWFIGGVLAAVIYALGAVMERTDQLEMRLLSLDTAVRNQGRE